MKKILSFTSFSLFSCIFSIMAQTALAMFTEFDDITWTLLEAAERKPHSRSAALEVVRLEVIDKIEPLLNRTLREGSICSRTPGQGVSYVMPAFADERMFSSSSRITIDPFTFTKVSQGGVDRTYPYTLQVLLQFTKPEGESFNGTLALNIVEGVLGKTVHIAAETTLSFSNDSLTPSFFEKLFWAVEQTSDNLSVKAEFLIQHPYWLRGLVDKSLEQRTLIEGLTLRLQGQGRRDRVSSVQLGQLPLGIARPVQIVSETVKRKSTSSVVTTSSSSGAATSSSTSSVATTSSTTTSSVVNKLPMEKALRLMGNGLSFMGNDSTNFRR